MRTRISRPTYLQAIGVPTQTVVAQVEGLQGREQLLRSMGKDREISAHFSTVEPLYEGRSE